MFIKPKPAADDFTEDMLPHTRKEVFFDVLKLHWTKFLLLGLISLIFSVPLFVCAIFKDLYLLTAYSELKGDELVNQVRNINNLFAAINIPCYLIYFVGFCALARIIKLYAFEEPVSLSTDFAKGCKQNIKQYLLLGLFFAVIVFGCSYFRSASLTAEGGGVVWNLGLIPTVVFSLIFAPIGAYMTVTQSVYAISFRLNIKYGFILYSKNIFKTLLAALCCFVPFILQIFPLISGSVFYVHIVGYLICPFIVPIIMLGFWLFTYNRLDMAINKDYYPQLVNKGTVPKSLQEEKEVSLLNKNNDL